MLRFAADRQVSQLKMRRPVVYIIRYSGVFKGAFDEVPLDPAKAANQEHILAQVRQCNNCNYLLHILVLS